MYFICVVVIKNIYVGFIIKLSGIYSSIIVIKGN